MEATDLRIGNYVELICDGHEHEPDLLKWSLDDFDFYSDRMKDVKPIELTEDILLKCGYFKIDNAGVIHFYVKGHSIWLCNELFLCEKNGVMIKYLHQLQNLYFALTNQEVTINL